MPRARDLGIEIGALPTGPTNSVLDVAGVGLGHATVHRDEPLVARTGVTCLLLAEDAYHRPVPAGGAVLNGAGECTGFLTAAEWGAAETPVYLTSTMQLGRVYDAACEIALEAHPEVASEVVIPVVGECDDSWLNDCRRMHVTADDVRRAHEAALGSRGGGTRTGRGCGRRRHRHVVPGLQGRHRHRLPDHRRGPHGRRAAAHELRRPRGADRRRRAARPDAAAGTGRATEARRLLHRAGGDRRPGRRGVLRPAGPAGRARAGADRLGRPPRQRRDLPRPSGPACASTATSARTAYP